MLAREAADDSLDVLGASSVHSRPGLGVCGFRILLLRRQSEVPRLPPVQLGHVLDAAFREPWLISQRSPEVGIRVLFFDLEDGRV